MGAGRTAVKHDREGVRDCLAVRHGEESDVDGQVGPPETSEVRILGGPRHVRRLAPIRL
jgi:hypothetical protein